MPYADRVTLATTYDYALLRGTELSRAADCLTKTAAWLPAECHVRAEADVLRELSLQPEVRAVGFQQTSVAENVWWVSGPDEDGRPYHVDWDASHFWVFDEVPEEAR